MDGQQQREGESAAMVTHEGKCAPRSLSMRWGQLGALVGHDGRCLAPDLLPVTFLTHRERLPSPRHYLYKNRCLVCLSPQARRDRTSIYVSSVGVQ